MLPYLPWLEKAVPREQHQLVDFGFAKIPTMTREDVIIAKLHALAIEPNRFKDLDDLKVDLDQPEEIEYQLLEERTPTPWSADPQNIS